MRRFQRFATACALLLASQMSAQTTDHTTFVSWNQTNLCAFFTGTKTASYRDTAGASWTALKIRLRLALATFSSQPGPGTVTVAINGVHVGGPVTVTNTTSSCDSFVTYEFVTTSRLAGYKPFDVNTIWFTNVGGSVGNGTEKAELIFTMAPKKFAFDLVPAMPQKMIIHPAASDRDLSGWQVQTGLTERPRFRFRGAVSNDAAGTSLESDIWLRVVDPADPSLYMPTHPPNDNRDPQPRGVLMPRSCADSSCRAAPGAPLRVRSSPGGVVEVELEGTDRYAGDNYYLEASFDPSFTCATSGTEGANACARSGLVTAWKRVFIEKRRALKNGLFLAEDANAGDSYIITRGNRWRGNRKRTDAIAKNETIIIVHAPQLDRTDVDAGWYAETHTVLSVEHLSGDSYRVNLGSKQGNTTVVESLEHDYRVESFDRRIGDAVSKLDGPQLTPADLNDASMTLVTGEAFLDAFTENVILPDQTTSDAAAFVPYVATAEESLLQNLAEKWSSVVNGTLAPNHQLLIIASTNSEDPMKKDGAGLTITHLPTRTSSWVFKQNVAIRLKAESGLRGDDSALVEMWALKTSAHEIAHQWRANEYWNSADHCPTDTKTWNDPSAYCLLAGHSDAGAGLVSQRTNGIARFHIITLPGGEVNSEYLGIRRRPDPFVPEASPVSN